MNRTIYLLWIAATLLLTGCLGYELGGTRPEGIETVHLAAIINSTTEPALELQVTEAFRGRIQFDGRLKLRNHPAEADAVIEVEITEYLLTPISFREDLQSTPDQYRLRITAKATLTSRATGEVLARSENYGESRFRFESDLTTAKRNALMPAAEELARLVVDDLIEQWN